MMDLEDYRRSHGVERVVVPLVVPTRGGAPEVVHGEDLAVSVSVLQRDDDVVWLDVGVRTGSEALAVGRVHHVPEHPWVSASSARLGPDGHTELRIASGRATGRLVVERIARRWATTAGIPKPMVGLRADGPGVVQTLAPPETRVQWDILEEEIAAAADESDVSWSTWLSRDLDFAIEWGWTAREDLASRIHAWLLADTVAGMPMGVDPTPEGSSLASTAVVWAKLEEIARHGADAEHRRWVLQVIRRLADRVGLSDGQLESLITTCDLVVDDVQGSLDANGGDAERALADAAAALRSRLEDRTAQPGDNVVSGSLGPGGLVVYRGARARRRAPQVRRELALIQRRADQNRQSGDVELWLVPLRPGSAYRELSEDFGDGQLVGRLDLVDTVKGERVTNVEMTLADVPLELAAVVRRSVVAADDPTRESWRVLATHRDVPQYWRDLVASTLSSSTTDRAEPQVSEGDG